MAFLIFNHQSEENVFLLFQCEKRIVAADEKLGRVEEENKKLKAEAVKMEKQLTEHINKLRTELKEWIFKNSKLVTHAEYHEEKCKVLDTNLKSCKKQIQALEERNQMLSQINAKHEQSIIHLKDEAMSAQSSLSKVEVRLENLRQENFLLKTAEARLVKESEVCAINVSISTRWMSHSNSRLTFWLYMNSFHCNGKCQFLSDFFHIKFIMSTC